MSLASTLICTVSIIKYMNTMQIYITASCTLTVTDVKIPLNICDLRAFYFLQRTEWQVVGITKISCSKISFLIYGGNFIYWVEKLRWNIKLRWCIGMGSYIGFWWSTLYSTLYTGTGCSLCFLKSPSSNTQTVSSTLLSPISWVQFELWGVRCDVPSGG